MNEWTCLICDTVFLRTTRSRKYCSDVCSSEADRRRMSEHYDRTTRTHKPGDSLVAECRDCGAHFAYVVRKQRRRVCDSCKRANKTPTDPTGRFRRYGVTREWCEAQLVRQGGKCANKACDRSAGHHGVWYIDHDHATEIVRGLLCPGCNFAIGHAQDDIDVLVGLANYLRPHRQLRLVI